MGLSTSTPGSGAVAGDLREAEVDVEARPLPARLILSPVGSPDTNLNVTSRRDSTTKYSHRLSKPDTLEPSVATTIRWRVVVQQPSATTGTDATTAHSRRKSAPQHVLLVGDWDPSHPVRMQLVSRSGAGQASETLLYQANLSLPAGLYRFYFDVDGRPELDPDQPIEDSRNVIIVAPAGTSASDISLGVPRGQPRSLHLDIVRSVPQTLERIHLDRTGDGRSAAGGRSLALHPTEPTSSTPVLMPINGTSAPTLSTHFSHLNTPSSSLASHSSGRNSAVSPLLAGGLPSSPHPSAVAKLFHDRYDPDDEGWGQSVPDFPRDSSGSPTKAPSSAQRAPGPPELPVYLERALLNSGPVADDPAILPLPPRSMLNHVYVRSATLDLQHVILGLTSRYRDKFVTVVLYKPSARMRDKEATAGAHAHHPSLVVEPSGAHGFTPPTFPYSDELLGD